MYKPKTPVHPMRPWAYELLTHPFWPYRFESHDPGVTSFPVEVQYPFFDLRLVRYLLRVPPMPWFMNKEILREAMRGILPEPVRLRPKTPLAGNSELEMLRELGAGWVDHFESATELAKYIDRSSIPLVIGERNTDRLWMNLRPLSLNYWLQRLRAGSYTFRSEEIHESTR
jgi:asparagine synthase (glutamine-hydrolysing)